MALKLFRVSTFLFKYITTFSQKGHIKLIKSGRKDIYNITKFAYFDYYELWNDDWLLWKTKLPNNENLNIEVPLLNGDQIVTSAMQ